jgi:hypothetical protein
VIYGRYAGERVSDARREIPRFARNDGVGVRDDRLPFRNEAVWDWCHDENCCRLGGGRGYGVGVAVLGDEANTSEVQEPASELSHANTRDLW